MIKTLKGEMTRDKREGDSRYIDRKIHTKQEMKMYDRYTHIHMLYV